MIRTLMTPIVAAVLCVTALGACATPDLTQDDTAVAKSEASTSPTPMPTPLLPPPLTAQAPTQASQQAASTHVQRAGTPRGDARAPYPRASRNRATLSPTERAPTPLETLTRANSAARQRPHEHGFRGAQQIYAFEPGALFELYANPSFVSTILLEPGETLTDIAAGDTARWMVSEAIAESDAEPRTLVLVKPHAIGLRTNIVLITDRRTYLVEAISQGGRAYAAQIAWSYPASPNGIPVTTPIDRLNFSYQVRTVRGSPPVWTPTRVFDDGRRTWIEFARPVQSADLPPLFILTGEGAELVNYRTLRGPTGLHYQVDRVFDRAELRLGVQAQTIVRIERETSSPRSGPRIGGRP